MGYRKQNDGASRLRKMLVDVFSSFDTIHERDGMDGQTNNGRPNGGA